jgi:hypothetical protein
VTPRAQRWIRAGVWIVLVVPALYQLVLLGTAIAGRVGYPYDLEWMEGGMLHHAMRLRAGYSIYPPPSIEFIPYLYTPLYPGLLAVFGGVFGLGYTLGRMISVLSLIGIAAVGAASIASPRFRHVSRATAWSGVVIALGLFAAIYPYVEGWYDLVRADTLFLFMVTGGLAAAAHWTTAGTDWSGHIRVAAVAAILALSFFAKQTGIFYVALGAAIVVAINWRRITAYIVVAGVIGLGFTGILSAATNGWFWTYIREIHSAHDFNMDRFWKSFGNILGHFPAMTIIVVITLGVVGYTWLRPPAAGSRRELPRQARPFLLWTSAFAVSTLVGAIGWGTEFAHFNAYMPAFLHGALATGAAIPALAACIGILFGAERRVAIAIDLVPMAAAIALGVTLYSARWSPRAFVPTDADVAAGNRLIGHLATLEGDVWMPSHPWYLVLADKTPHVHRMGIKDVTTRQTRVVAGLDDALSSHRFGALVFDDRDLFLELPQIQQYYRPAQRLPADERPRLYTGAKVVPNSIWVPAVPAVPPSGATTLFDFETAGWDRWTRSGAAWGPSPVAEPQPGQDLVIGATGRRFATSIIGGDVATGRMTSPSFPIKGAKISLKLGGLSDTTKLRVELWVDGGIVKTAAVPLPGGDTLRTVTWDVTELSGKDGTLVLVDDSTEGHLDVDDVWIWANP